MPPADRVGKYSLQSTLGEGAFGKVKLAVDASGAAYAIKIMEKAHIERHGLTLQVRREIAVMRAMRHPNIVNLHEVLNSSKKLYMVMDLVTGGELFDAVAARGRLDEPTARSYFQQLVDGIEYCHSRRVYHRDLKPENLLLSGDRRVLKITDFGLASIKAHNATSELLHTVMGSPHYIAPEIITSAKDGYDGAMVDVWASGVILYGMLAGSLPFDCDGTRALYHAIVHEPVAFPRHFPPDPAKIIRGMLHKDPAHRTPLADVRATAWFQADYTPPPAPPPPPHHISSKTAHGAAAGLRHPRRAAARATRELLGNGAAAAAGPGPASADPVDAALATPSPSAGSSSSSVSRPASPSAGRKDREKRRAGRKDRKSVAPQARADAASGRDLSSASGASATSASGASLTSDAASSGDAAGHHFQQTDEASASAVRAKRAAFALKEMKARVIGRRKSQIGLVPSASSVRNLGPTLRNLKSTVRSGDDSAAGSSPASHPNAPSSAGGSSKDPSGKSSSSNSRTTQRDSSQESANSSQSSLVQLNAKKKVPDLVGRNLGASASPHGTPQRTSALGGAGDLLKRNSRIKPSGSRILRSVSALRINFGNAAEFQASPNNTKASPAAPTGLPKKPSFARPAVPETTPNTSKASAAATSGLPTRPSFAEHNRRLELPPSNFTDRRDSKESNDLLEEPRPVTNIRRAGTSGGIPTSKSRHIPRSGSRNCASVPSLRQSTSYTCGSSANTDRNINHEPPPVLTRLPSVGIQGKDNLIHPEVVPVQVFKECSNIFATGSDDNGCADGPASSALLRMFSNASETEHPKSSKDNEPPAKEDSRPCEGPSEDDEDQLERQVRLRMQHLASTKFIDACEVLKENNAASGDADSDAAYFDAIEVDVTGEDESSESDSEPKKTLAERRFPIRLHCGITPRGRPPSIAHSDDIRTPRALRSTLKTLTSPDAFTISSPLTPQDDKTVTSVVDQENVDTFHQTSSNTIGQASNCQAAEPVPNTTAQVETSSSRILLTNPIHKSASKTAANSSFCFKKISTNSLISDLLQAQAPDIADRENESTGDGESDDDFDENQKNVEEYEIGEEESAWDHGVPQNVIEELYKQDHDNGYPPWYSLGFDVFQDCDESAVTGDGEAYARQRQRNIEVLIKQGGKSVRLPQPNTQHRVGEPRKGQNTNPTAYMIEVLKRYSAKAVPVGIRSGVSPKVSKGNKNTTFAQTT